MAIYKQFNYLNFLYGIGATIILVAAMFKFLGWRYANTIFVIGILVEAVVFLISAFDWGADGKNYNWEKVFPQLHDEDEYSSQEISLNAAEGTQQQQIQKIMDTIVALNGSVNELNTATKKLTSSVSTMEKNYDTVTESTRHYQEEIDALRAKISRANENLKVFENYNIRK